MAVCPAARTKLWLICWPEPWPSTLTSPVLTTTARPTAVRITHAADTPAAITKRVPLPPADTLICILKHLTLSEWDRPPVSGPVRGVLFLIARLGIPAYPSTFLSFCAILKNHRDKAGGADDNNGPPVFQMSRFLPCPKPSLRGVFSPAPAANLACPRFYKSIDRSGSPAHSNIN